MTGFAIVFTPDCLLQNYQQSPPQAAFSVSFSVWFLLAFVVCIICIVTKSIHCRILNKQQVYILRHFKTITQNRFSKLFLLVKLLSTSQFSGGCV
jgi:Na+/melibiose symporter-like transporter